MASTRKDDNYRFVEAMRGLYIVEGPTGGNYSLSSQTLSSRAPKLKTTDFAIRHGIFETKNYLTRDPDGIMRVQILYRAARSFTFMLLSQLAL